MRVILVVLFLCFLHSGYSQCGTPVVRELTTTEPNGWYRGSLAGFNAGDTLKFMGTYYSIIEFYGTETGGNYSCPFVIVANTYFHADNIRFKGGAHNFKILSTGGGKDTTTYRNITTGNVALDDANHIEVNGLRISGADVGFYNKMNVTYENRRSWFPAAPMTGNKLIGCFISDINGESIYSGLTQENGYTVTSSYSGLDTVIVGNIADSTQILNNIILRSYWDGVQLAHAGYGNIIDGNIIRDFGTGDIGNQRAGVIVGGDVNAQVSNNIIEKGTGNGLEIFGFGSINVYGNTIDSVGRTQDDVNGEESLYAVYHTVSYTSRPPLALYIHDNKINHPMPKGAIRNDTNGNEVGSLIVNNTFCIPDAPPTWQNTYFKLNVPSTTNSNNILQCQTPVSGCNCLIGMKFVNN